MFQLTIVVVSLLSLVALFTMGTHAYTYGDERDPVDPTDPIYQSIVDGITPDLYSSLKLSPADYRFTVGSLSAAREIDDPEEFMTGPRPFYLDFYMQPIYAPGTIGTATFMSCSATVVAMPVPPPTGSDWKIAEDEKGPKINCEMAV